MRRPKPDVRQLSARIPKELWEELTAHCAETKQSGRAFLEAAIREGLANRLRVTSSRPRHQPHGTVAPPPTPPTPPARPRQRIAVTAPPPVPGVR